MVCNGVHGRQCTRHWERCSNAVVDGRCRYARHRPEDTVLYRIVEQHLGSFFDSVTEQGGSFARRVASTARHVRPENSNTLILGQFLVSL